MEWLREQFAKSRSKGTGLFSKKTQYWGELGLDTIDVTGTSGYIFEKGTDELGDYLDKYNRKMKNQRNMYLMILGGVIYYYVR